MRLILFFTILFVLIACDEEPYRPPRYTEDPGQVCAAYNAPYEFRFDEIPNEDSALVFCQKRFWDTVKEIEFDTTTGYIVHLKCCRDVAE